MDINDHLQNDDSVENVTYKLVLAEIEKEEHLQQVKDMLLQQFDIGENHLLTLGNMGADSQIQTVSSHLMSQLRKHGLHKNEREMLLSYEEMLVTVQLCLADLNKEECAGLWCPSDWRCLFHKRIPDTSEDSASGELKYGSFEVEASSVLEIHKNLVEDKLHLTPLSQAPTAEYKTLRSRYDDFLKQCNLLDCIDLMNRIKDEMGVNEVLCKHLAENNFLVVNYTANQIEQAMIRFLLGNKSCYSTSQECSLDESLIDGGSVSVRPCDALEKLNGTHSRTTSTPGNLSDRSVTEKYTEKVVMAYLQLLVNSRSELALAQVFNIPERELDQKAFTALKHEARAKKMSMFQASVSHVMRIRLGGKSYQPDRNAVLSQFVKGLADLTDLIQRLVTIIEEDKQPSSAIRRVMNILKNTILKCQDKTLRRPSVEAITAKLQTFAQTTLEGYQKHQEDSPKRDAHHGGSLVGRRTIRVIRAVIDRYSARLPSNVGIDCLTDIYSSQSTPVRFPSVFSNFRSPLESSPDGKESQSLRDRLMAKSQKQHSKKQSVPRFKASMDWAMPLHDVGLYRENSMSAVIEDFVPSKTIVHASENRKVSVKSTVAKKVLESLHDQENTLDGFSNREVNASSVNSETNNSSQANQNPKKRALGVASQLGQPVQKKAKKESKKKGLPLQKGQKQLTAFFRL